MKPEVRITNWGTSANLRNPYQPPEGQISVLFGDVVNHPTLGSVKGLLSSHIVNLDLKNRRVETNNTVYLLDGPPDANWIKYLESINYDLSKLPK